MSPETLWLLLQDQASGPWALVNALSDVSEMEGQDIAEFKAWLGRLAEVARLNADPEVHA